jgi:alpha-galactosidase
MPDATNFPEGMIPVGKYIHDKGLKFGIYSSAGTLTCEKRAASLGKETIDAEDFAFWGVDYLKYDNCYNANVPAPERYKAMSDALVATGRPIYYSVCSWGVFNDWEWAP